MNYILVNKTPVLEPDSLKWALQFNGKADCDRIIAQDKIGDILVSTVFLGIDHSFGGDGPPVLFETMVFGGAHDSYQNRYCTWDEAEAGHNEALEMVKIAVENFNPVDLSTIYEEAKQQIKNGHDI